MQDKYHKISDTSLLYLNSNLTDVENKKEEKVKKTDEEVTSKNEEGTLDGKKLYDFYRHTTKLIE